MQVSITYPDGTKTMIEDVSEVSYEENPAPEGDLPAMRSIRFEANAVVLMLAESMHAFIAACGDLFEKGRYAPNQKKKKPRGRKAKAFARNVWKQYVVLLQIERINRERNLAEIERRMTPRYGVKLLRYEGMGEMNAWVEAADGVPRAHETIEAAEAVAESYRMRNPKGKYVVEVIP